MSDRLFERRPAPSVGWTGTPHHADTNAALSSPPPAAPTVQQQHQHFDPQFGPSVTTVAACGPSCPWRQRFRDEEERSAKLVAANGVLRETQQYLIEKCSATAHTLTVRIAELEQDLAAANQHARRPSGSAAAESLRATNDLEARLRASDEENARLQRELRAANEANYALLEQVDTMQLALETMSDRYEAILADVQRSRNQQRQQHARPSGAASSIPPLAPASPVPTYPPAINTASLLAAAGRSAPDNQQSPRYGTRERSASESSRPGHQRSEMEEEYAARYPPHNYAADAARRQRSESRGGSSSSGGGYNRDAVMASAYEAVQPMMMALRTLEDAVRLTPTTSEHGGSRPGTPSGRRFGSDGPAALAAAREAMQLASPRDGPSADLNETLAEVKDRLKSLEDENRHLYETVVTVQQQTRALARAPLGAGDGLPSSVPPATAETEAWRSRVDAAVAASNEWRVEALRRETERVRMEAAERRRVVDEAIREGIEAEARYVDAHHSDAVTSLRHARAAAAAAQSSPLPPASPPKPQGYAPPPSAVVPPPPPQQALRRERSWNLPPPPQAHDSARSLSSSVSGVVPVGASQSMVNLPSSSFDHEAAGSAEHSTNTRRWRSLTPGSEDGGDAALMQAKPAIVTLRPNVLDASSQSDHEDAPSLRSPRVAVDTPNMTALTFGAGQPIAPSPTMPVMKTSAMPPPTKLPLKLPLKLPMPAPAPAATQASSAAAPTMEAPATTQHHAPPPPPPPSPPLQPADPVAERPPVEAAVEAPRAAVVDDEAFVQQTHGPSSAQADASAFQPTPVVTATAPPAKLPLKLPLKLPVSLAAAPATAQPNSSAANAAAAPTEASTEVPRVAPPAKLPLQLPTSTSTAVGGVKLPIKLPLKLPVGAAQPTAAAAPPEAPPQGDEAAPPLPPQQQPQQQPARPAAALPLKLPLATTGPGAAAPRPALPLRSPQPTASVESIPPACHEAAEALRPAVPTAEAPPPAAATGAEADTAAAPPPRAAVPAKLPLKLPLKLPMLPRAS